MPTDAGLGPAPDMARAALLARLDRLEGYLRVDGSNAPLLADAFDTALAAGAFERAAFHCRHAEALGHDRAAWTWRGARLAMAERRFADAQAALRQLASAQVHGFGPGNPALSHDIALVELHLGNAVAGIGWLAGWMDGTDDALALPESGRRPDPARDPSGDLFAIPPRAVDPALVTLWLRLLHHAGELDRAMVWIARHEAAAQSLDARSAGIASLLALDAGDHAASRRWADRSLAAPEAPPVEALVARASLALAERDAAGARALAERAIEANPADGRSWSALAFAELLDGRLAAAQGAFDRAVASMPTHVGTWHGLGWTGIAARDLALARRAFDASLALDRTFAESWGGLAVVQVLGGERDAARASIDRALGLDRASLAARYAESLLSGDAQDAESLQRLAERLLRGRQAPLGGEILDLLKKR